MRPAAPPGRCRGTYTEPRVALAAEILGAIVVMIAISAIVSIGRGRAAGGRFPAAPAGALLLAIIGAVALCSGLVPRIRTLDRDHALYAGFTLAEANAYGGGTLGMNEGFLAFAAEHIPAHARVYVACSPTCGSFSDWFGFRLTPRVLEPSASQAQWALLYQVTPAAAGVTHGWRIIPFTPGFALAQAVR